VLNDFNRWLQDSVFKPLEDKKMPVMEHLVELQVRLTRAVIVTAIVFVATFFYADTLVKWLRIPLQNMFVPSTLSWEPTDLPTVPFVFLAPAEALWQNVKVAGLFAIVLATPYILIEIWQFVVPGLHVQERRFVGPFVFLSTLAFLAGITFSFFFVLPFALNFLISYGVSAGFIPQLSIAQYVGFALWFLLVFGLIFEVPLAITLMAKLGWVDAPFLRRYRKWALLGAFIIAAILTPTPDPFNQCLMALPMYIFYEVGIVSAGFFNKKKAATQDATTGVPAMAMAPAGAAAGAGVRMGKSSDDDYVGVPTGTPRR
jgi:sec-independent protein translocase protein TatC